MALLELQLDSEEQKLLQKQGDMTALAIPIQLDIIELIQQDELEQARALLNEEAIESQNNVLNTLGELLQYQQKSSRTIRETTDTGIDQAEELVVFWSLIAILVGTIISTVVIRRTGIIEARVKLENERAIATLRSISDGIVRLDLDGQIEFMNNAAENVLGVIQKGNSIREIIPFKETEDHRRFNLSLNEFDLSSDYKLGVYPLSNSDKTQWAELNLVPIKNDDTISGYVLGIANITELKQSEINLLELNETLEEKVNQRTQNLAAMNETLKKTIETLQETKSKLVESEKMASLGNLVAGISHEINTPVGIGITSATHIQEKLQHLENDFNKNDLKKSHLEKFISQASAASKILVQNLQRASDLIRSFKHVAVDQSSDEWRKINLKDYCDEIILSLHPKLKNKSVDITNNIDPEIELHTNPGAIYQILSNFILNSLSHGFEDKNTGQIEIEAKNHTETTTMIYRDDGNGMTEESRKHIFEPFYTTKRGSGGSGLGMNIVYNLVKKQLNGDIDLNSEQGEGVEIRVALPA